MYYVNQYSCSIATRPSSLNRPTVRLVILCRLTFFTRCANSALLPSSRLLFVKRILLAAFKTLCWCADFHLPWLSLYFLPRPEQFYQSRSSSPQRKHLRLRETTKRNCSSIAEDLYIIHVLRSWSAQGSFCLIWYIIAVPSNLGVRKGMFVTQN